MNEALALRLLRKIMDWDEETATREYRWVRLVSRLKYDGYRDYVAGVRFCESLAGWLSQFDFGHRAAAYAFVKNRLVYFSPLEINRLVDQLYPRFIEPRLRKDVGVRTGVAAWTADRDPGTEGPHWLPFSWEPRLECWSWRRLLRSVARISFTVSLSRRRDLGVSRKVVRKVIRSEATEFRYEREAQPLPRIGPWSDKLDQLLVANEGKASRERLTLTGNDSCRQPFADQSDNSPVTAEFLSATVRTRVGSTTC